MSNINLIKIIKKNIATKTALFLTIFLFSSYLLIADFIVSKRHVEETLTRSINGAETNINEMFANSEQALIDIIQEYESRPNNISHLYKTIQRVRGLRYKFNKIPWTEFSWLDSRNNIIADSKLGVIRSKNKINLSKRDYVQKAIKLPYKIQIGSQVIGSTSFKKMIPFGMSSAKKGMNSGAIVLGMEIPRVVDIIKDSLPSNTVLFVLGVENEFLLSSDEEMFSKGKIIKKGLIKDAIRIKKNGNASSQIQFFFLSGYDVAIKISEKYPFTFIALYHDSENYNNFFSKYSVKIKMLILIMLSVILLLLNRRFNKLH